MGLEIPDCLAESGPVAYDSGLDAADIVHRIAALAQIKGTELDKDEYSKLAPEFVRLAGMGAQLISVNPPMWVLDDHPMGLEFVKFAEREIASSPQGSFLKIDNPGSYVLQERFSIAKDVTGEESLRPELNAMNNFVKQLSGADTTFLDTGRKTVTVKRHNIEGSEEGETDRLPHSRFYALERLHIDRNRNPQSRSYRAPMRFTMVLSYDDLGGTYFPFAESIEFPGLQRMPDGVEKVETCVDSGSAQTCRKASSGNTHWPLQCPTEKSRGLLVSGRRGRILVFASSSWKTSESVPLYASLHQGVLFKKCPPHAVQGLQSPARQRMVTVIGWDEEEFETSGRHECMEGESIECRASVFNRTIEEEALGMMMGNTRSQEASNYMQGLARQRGSTIESLVRAELMRDSSNNQSSIQRETSREIMNQMDRTGATSADAIMQAIRGVQAAQAERWHWNQPSLYASYSSSRPAIAQSEPSSNELPPLFWETVCCVCQGDFVQPPESSPPKGAILPGFLSCGHLTCQECYSAMSRCPQLKDLSGRVRCPVCRKSCAREWQPLTMPDGKNIKWKALPDKKEAGEKAGDKEEVDKAKDADEHSDAEAAAAEAIAPMVFSREYHRI
mmetsp:Transcript_43078/g.80134  ORF Transcript_43078/g.80134 Transcript_43078/m.80134 type:complete len:617 (+) Transcript_43078:69-1919(+)